MYVRVRTLCTKEITESNVYYIVVTSTQRTIMFMLFFFSFDEFMLIIQVCEISIIFINIGLGSA